VLGAWCLEFLKSMRERYYFIKIFVLLLSTAVGVLVIWWSMIREEGADWISGQIVHEVSPFAITRTDDGTIVSNVVSGYEFTVPVELKVLGSKNLTFISESSAVNCQIKYPIKMVKQQKQEEEKEIVFKGEKFSFTIMSDQASQISCLKYFERIKNSFALF